MAAPKGNQYGRKDDPRSKTYTTRCTEEEWYIFRNLKRIMDKERG